MKTFFKRLVQVALIIGVVIIVLSILGGDKNKDQSKDTDEFSSTDGKTGTNQNSNTNDISVIQKGDRILAIHVIEQSGNAKGSPRYDASFKSALEAGVESVNMAVNWNDAETSGGIFKPNVFTQANKYYASRKVKMDLGLRPVDTAGIMLPDDLKGKSLNDPEVIRRFKQFLDNVFGAMPDVQLNFLAIGNEVDTVFVNDKAKFTEYNDFLNEIIPYAKQKRPGLKVGVVVAYAGLVGSDSDEYQKLNALTDLVMLTYYPIKGDFTTKKLPVFEKEISKVFKLYPGRQIYFTELGYPSSEVSDGSEEKQAQFIREVFQVWDKNKDRIAGIAFFTFNELTTDSVDDLTKYFSVATEEFKATIGSIGLVTADGKEKAALNVFREEAKKRGW